MNFPTAASIVAAAIVCPALANDPSMASSTNTTTKSAPSRTTTTMTVTANTGRRVWVKKRIVHLKQKMTDDNKAQRTADNIDLMLGNFPGPRSPTYTRQHMLDRFEFLALKKEAKGLTQKEYVEMQWLRQKLLSGH